MWGRGGLMTNRPQSRLNYNDLLCIALRVMGDEGECVRAEDDRSVAPKDGEPRIRAERVVLRAMRRIVNHKTRWTYSHRTMTFSTVVDGSGPLNVKGRAWEYALPWYFGGLRGPMRRTTGTLLGVEQISESDLLNYRAHNDSSGNPRLYALRYSNHGPSIAFYPTPDSAETFELDVVATPNPMILPTDTFYFGVDGDECIEKAVQLEASLESRLELRELYEGEFNKALEKLSAHDNRNKPRYAGSMRRHISENSYDSQGIERIVPIEIQVYGTTVLNG